MKLRRSLPLRTPRPGPPHGSSPYVHTFGSALVGKAVELTGGRVCLRAGGGGWAEERDGELEGAVLPADRGSGFDDDQLPL